MMHCIWGVCQRFTCLIRQYERTFCSHHCPSCISESFHVVGRDDPGLHEGAGPCQVADRRCRGGVGAARRRGVPLQGAAHRHEEAIRASQLCVQGRQGEACSTHHIHEVLRANKTIHWAFKESSKSTQSHHESTKKIKTSQIVLKFLFIQGVSRSKRSELTS